MKGLHRVEVEAVVYVVAESTGEAEGYVERMLSTDGVVFGCWGSQVGPGHTPDPDWLDCRPFGDDVTGSVRQYVRGLEAKQPDPRQITIQEAGG